MKPTADEYVSFEGLRSGHRLNFPNALRCPTCNYPLLFDWVLQDGFPYLHCDWGFKCLKCGWTGTFGMATNPLFGMELIIWDSNPLGVLLQAHETTPPDCPFHLKPMILTKIWGDKVMRDEHKDEILIQWKCPETFYVQGKLVKRTCQSKQAYTAEERERIMEKLEQLGYAD